MKRVVHILFFLFFPITLIGLPTSVLVMSIDHHPKHQPTALTPEMLQKARQAISKQQFNQLDSGNPIKLTLNEAQLNAVTQTLQTLKPGTASQLSIQNEQLQLSVSYPINFLGSPAFLNVQTSVLPGKQLRFSNTSIGQLNIPDVLSTSLNQSITTLLFGNKTSQQLSQSIHDIEIQGTQLSATIDPSISKLERFLHIQPLAKSTESSDQHLNEYLTVLHKVFGKPYKHKQSLTHALQIVFNYAYHRTKGYRTAANENETAISALAIYFGDSRLARFYNIQNPPKGQVRLTLAKRTDWMKHFLISAGVTITTHETLADAVGIMKEIQDAKTTSGFSFTDIAADRAGIKFAKFATQDERSARFVQNQLKQIGFSENLIFPSMENIPEWLKQAEFKQQFGSSSDPRYIKIMDMIQQRVNHSDLYQQPYND